MSAQGQEENKHTQQHRAKRHTKNPNMATQGCQEAEGASQDAQTSRLQAGLS